MDSNYKIGGRRSIQQFNNNFFYKYRAVNAEKFIEEVEACTSKWIDNSAFTWGSHCNSDKVPLKLEDFEYLMKPNIDMLIGEIGSDITPKYSDPWINMYTRGQYQEIHDHHGVDFASVFFPQDQENDFGKFYFFDRHNNSLNTKWKQIFDITPSWEPYVSAGDIIFFPSNVLNS